jgi:hypothetical protein
MNMIERVAKAIYEKLNMRGNACLSDYGDDLGDVVVDGRVDLLDIAKAAIEAMRGNDKIEQAAQIVELKLTTALTADTVTGRMLHRLDGAIIRDLATAIRSLKDE